MIDMRHKGTQIIHTDRLVLRPFTIADARPAFNSIYSDSRVWEHMRMSAMPSLEFFRERLKDWVSGYKCAEQYLWAVTLAKSGEIIGSIGVHESDEGGRWEAGYCYAVKHWGDGYATEVLYGVCEFMFEAVEAEELYCSHSVHNSASKRVIEKTGFIYEADIIIDKPDGTTVPGKGYCLKKEDFLNI